MAENLENNVTTETTETEGQATETPKTYSQEEVDAMLQKEGDRRISQYQKTIEKKQREAEKLRGMNAEEQREYNLSQREQALAAKELELAMLENKSEGLSILAEKGLDAKLINFVLNEDAETMYENIKSLEKSFKASVKAEVERRLASRVPQKSYDTNGISKEQFAKMTISQMQELYATNPDLFNSLKS